MLRDRHMQNLQSTYARFKRAARSQMLMCVFWQTHPETMLEISFGDCAVIVV